MNQGKKNIAKDISQKGFDKYTRYFLIAQLADQIRTKTPMRILDVGGADGLLGNFLKKDEVVIMDVQTVSPNIVLSDITHAPFVNRSFDLVVSSDVYEHISPKNRKKTVSEMLRISKNYIILGAPFYSPEIKEAEIIANNFWLKATGEQHRWLKEHIDNKLPREDELEPFLKERGYTFYKLGTNNLFLWLNVMLFSYYAQRYLIPKDKEREVYRFYNENFVELGDLEEPTYRKIYLIGKRGTLPRINLYKNRKIQRLKQNKLNSLIFNAISDISAQMDSRITMLKNDLQEKENSLQENKNDLQEKKNILQEKENSLQEKESQIHSLEFQIQQIQQSIVMQLANRYRRIMERLLPLGTRRRYYHELCLTGIRVILNEGWKSFWSNFKVWLKQQNTAREIAKLLVDEKPPTDDWSDYWVLSQKIAKIKTQSLKNFSPKKPEWQKQVNNLNRVRLIAFYFPQYHPIPENDRFWGRGFTEWTNVKKAQPNFVGHYQPHVPTDLGFYDLRNEDVMTKQAELAKRYGIYGFCYYYYWFAGKRVMEMPLERMLKTGKPDIPFCLCWANENWTRRWDGRDDLVLLEQQHSDEDDRAVIRDLIRYMKHPNYIRVNGKPLLLVYRANLFPDIKRTTKIWCNLCRKKGIGDIYLGMCESFEHAVENTPPSKYGFDASVEFPPHYMDAPIEPPGKLLNPNYKGKISDYREIVLRYAQKEIPDYTRFRTVMPRWDNTARRQNDSHIFLYSSPGAYQAWLEAMIGHTLKQNSSDECIVFINAWNEWAEGNYLEPDKRFGYGFLEATRNAMEATSKPIILKLELLKK